MLILYLNLTWNQSFEDILLDNFMRWSDIDKKSNFYKSPPKINYFTHVMTF